MLHVAGAWIFQLEVNRGKRVCVFQCDGLILGHIKPQMITGDICTDVKKFNIWPVWIIVEIMLLHIKHEARIIGIDLRVTFLQIIKVTEYSRLKRETIHIEKKL